MGQVVENVRVSPIVQQIIVYSPISCNVSGVSTHAYMEVGTGDKTPSYRGHLSTSCRASNLRKISLLITCN